MAADNQIIRIAFGLTLSHLPSEKLNMRQLSLVNLTRQMWFVVIANLLLPIVTTQNTFATTYSECVRDELKFNTYTDTRKVTTYARARQTQDFRQDSNLWRYTFKWELTANLEKFQESPDTAMSMPMVRVPKKDVEVITFGSVDPRIFNRFVKDDSVFWPKHPNNTSDRVPYFYSTAYVDRLDTRYTASRSLLSFEETAPAYSIKVGTNHPHRSELQPEKADTKDDVDGAILRQPLINAIDKKLRKDNILITVPEVLILKDKDTGQGVLIRDLSGLDDRNRIYLPGLSIPYVGREIAESNSANFENFWIKAYGEQVGRAKARLLLRYGILMESPNAQNILVELDKNLIPTGKIVIRDIVDSNMYLPWIEALQAEDVLQANIKAGYELKTRLIVTTSHPFSGFDKAGASSFSSGAMSRLWNSHDRGFVDEVKKELRIKNYEISTVQQLDVYPLLSGSFHRLSTS